MTRLTTKEPEVFVFCWEEKSVNRSEDFSNFREKKSRSESSVRKQSQKPETFILLCVTNVKSSPLHKRTELHHHKCLIFSAVAVKYILKKHQQLV